MIFSFNESSILNKQGSTLCVAIQAAQVKWGVTTLPTHNILKGNNERRTKLSLWLIYIVQKIIDLHLDLHQQQRYVEIESSCTPSVPSRKRDVRVCDRTEQT